MTEAGGGQGRLCRTGQGEAEDMRRERRRLGRGYVFHKGEETWEVRRQYVFLTCFYKTA